MKFECPKCGTDLASDELCPNDGSAPQPADAAEFDLEECYSFTRAELIDALTRVETVVLVRSGSGVINAESAADAIIEALSTAPKPVHYHWPVACDGFASGDLWTGDLDRVTCSRCLGVS